MDHKKSGTGETGKADAKAMTRDDVIKLIGRRYTALHFAALGRKKAKKEDVSMLGFAIARVMYILSVAVSPEGHRINLVKLANFKNEDLIHDVMGCSQAFDPKTNTLKNNFIPRCGFEG